MLIFIGRKSEKKVFATVPTKSENAGRLLLSKCFKSNFMRIR
jgi:hypothetical protein